MERKGKGVRFDEHIPINRTLLSELKNWRSKFGNFNKGGTPIGEEGPKGCRKEKRAQGSNGLKEGQPLTVEGKDGGS